MVFDIAPGAAKQSDVLSKHRLAVPPRDMIACRKSSAELHRRLAGRFPQKVIRLCFEVLWEVDPPARLYCPHPVKKTLAHLGIFFVAFVVGTLYAVLVGMSFAQLPGALIAWPIYIILFWLLFDKFKLLRLVGFVVVPPVLLIGFEFYWSARYPGAVADKYLAYDRSHYLPGTRVKAPTYNETDPNAAGWKLQEVFIGSDGFRADPTTERGNPKNCRYVLIGDSMIYGTGLAYAETIGPVLSEMGIEACVFGVTGNSPADYLATLQYAADRFAPGALVAFYIYAYNDFVILSKYLTRRIRGYSNRYPTIAKWTSRFDQ